MSTVSINPEIVGSPIDSKGSVAGAIADLSATGSATDSSVSVILGPLPEGREATIEEYDAALNAFQEPENQPPSAASLQQVELTNSVVGSGINVAVGGESTGTEDYESEELQKRIQAVTTVDVPIQSIKNDIDIPPFLKKRMRERGWDGATINQESISEIPSYVRKAITSDVQGWSDEKIANLGPNEVNAIEDTNAREFVERKRDSIENARKYRNLQQGDVVLIKDSEILNMSDIQINSIQNPNTRKDILERRKQLIDNQYADISSLNEVTDISSVTPQQIKNIKDETVREAVRKSKENYLTQDRTKKERIRYIGTNARAAATMTLEEAANVTDEQLAQILDKDAKTIIIAKREEARKQEASLKETSKFQTKLPKLTEEKVGKMSDEEIGQLTLEDANKVSDPKAKEKLKSRILDFTKKNASEESRAFYENLLNGNESMDLGAWTDKLEAQLIQMLEQDKTIEGPVKAAILKSIEIRKNEMQGKRAVESLQREADKKLLNKENITIRKKKLEIFFRNSKYILGGLMIGASVGLLASGVGESDKLFGLLIGGIGGVGLGYGGKELDKLYSGKRADLEIQLANARVARQKRENLSTQRDREAQTRELNGVSAYNKKIAEVRASMAGYMDPEQVAAFVGSFGKRSNLGLASFN